MNVLLPQPEGPMMAVTVFLRMSIVTPASASDLPYQTPRSWIEKTVGRPVISASASVIACSGMSICMPSGATARVSISIGAFSFRPAGGWVTVW